MAVAIVRVGFSAIGQELRVILGDDHLGVGELHVRGIQDFGKTIKLRQRIAERRIIDVDAGIDDGDLDSRARAVLPQGQQIPCVRHLV